MVTRQNLHIQDEGRLRLCIIK